jgi:hypothetical protein
VDGCKCMAVPGVARRHGGRRVTVHVRDHNFASFLQLSNHGTQSPDNLAHHFVQTATHIQIEVRLDTELLEHPPTQVLIVMLASVPEQDEVSAFLEFLVERHLLDDIGLCGNQNQVHVSRLVRGDVIEECGRSEGDLPHKNRVQVQDTILKGGSAEKLLPIDERNCTFRAFPWAREAQEFLDTEERRLLGSLTISDLFFRLAGSSRRSVLYS